jgi:hypothetical protein
LYRALARVQRIGAHIDDIHGSVMPAAIGNAVRWSVEAPFFTAWNFETLVLARTHVTALDGLNATARDETACMLQRPVARNDALFNVSAPCASSGLATRFWPGRSSISRSSRLRSA